jgi:hypothetical protein
MRDLPLAYSHDIATAMLMVLYAVNALIGYWLARTRAARSSLHSLGAGPDAAQLAIAVSRRLARALSIRRRPLSMGKDRARSGEKLAAR